MSSRFRSKYNTQTETVHEDIIELFESHGSSMSLEGKTDKEKIQLYYKLYTKDDLTFRIVNYLTSRISHTVLFIGDESVVKRLYEWANEVNFYIRIEDLVRDAIIAGTSWAECVPDGKTIAKIIIINPETMDFIRNNEGQAIVDENSEPMGFIQEVGSSKREWTEKAVTQNNEVLKKADKNEDLRDRIAFIKLISRGDSFLGISFVGAAYRSAMIRCNIADMVGEGAFRGGGILAQYDGDMPADQKKKLKTDLTGITAKNIMILKKSIELGTMPIADTANAADLLYRFADFQCSGMEVPLDILLAGGKNLQRDLITKIADMETSIAGYHDRLAEQVNDQIIQPLLEMWKVRGKARMKFISASPGAQLNRARVISTLARRNLMTYDPEMEMALRKEMDLPYELLKKVLEDWKSGKRPMGEVPEVGKEPNVIDTKDTQEINRKTKIPKSNKDRGKTDKADEVEDEE